MTSPNKWESRGDNCWQRRFGPLRASVYRVWGATPQPTKYVAYLTVPACNSNNLGADDLEVPVSDLGVDWSDEKADAVACKILERKIKKEIKSWAK